MEKFPFARAVFGDEMYVLVVVPGKNTMSLYLRGITIKNVYVIADKRPLAIVELTNPDAIIKMARHFGIKFMLVTDFIDKSYMDEWAKKLTYWRQLREIEAMSEETKLERVSTAFKKRPVFD